MSTFLTVLTLLAMLATAVTLGIGVVGMLKTNKNSAQKSNTLMRWRIFFQALALILFTILLVYGRH